MGPWKLQASHSEKKHASSLNSCPQGLAFLMPITYALFSLNWTCQTVFANIESVTIGKSFLVYKFWTVFYRA